MKDYFRSSMAWLHTWAGLALGWLLYFMFATGSAGYFDTEIDRWMKPEVSAATPQADTAPLAALGLARLEEVAAGAERWVINLARDRNDPWPRIFWQGAKPGSAAPAGNEPIDAATGALLPARATGGGQFLYQLHWRLHYLPRAITDWLVGAATMFMLVALVTGVIVHKRILKDFFTFRPGTGQRSWLDAHNVASVVSLPFQLMITYSGLVFMMFVCMPLVVAAYYGPGPDGREAFFDEVFEPPALAAPAGAAAELAPLAPIVAAAEARWGVGGIRSLDIRHPHDAHARIIVGGTIAGGPLRSAEELVFDGVSGELLAVDPAVGSITKAVRDVLLGLHEGLFAGPPLRALYFLSGLLGAAMIATGLVLWTLKRRQRAEKAGDTPHFGLRLVERLNVGAIVGLPVAIAAYFWANRLLPLDLPARAAREADLLFLVWVLLLAHAALRPAARAWVEQLWLAAGAFGLLPLLNALTTGRHLAHSLPAGDWGFAGFDLAMLGFGVVFAASARSTARRILIRAPAPHSTVLPAMPNPCSEGRP